MSVFNLMPGPVCLTRRKHRTAIRVLVASASYGVICIIGAAIFSVQTHVKIANSEQELLEIRAEAHEVSTEINQLVRELSKGRSTPDARTLIGQQPRWDVFLAMLGTAGDENVVFAEIACGPAVQNTPDDPVGFETNIIGFAQTHQDVSDFVLRLEAYNVFDTISIQQSRREPFLQDHAISFTVRCILQPSKSEGA